MQVVRVGGVRGRHDMPVERYLIDRPDADVRTAAQEAFQAMERILSETEADAIIRFYPTGLTSVTLGALAAFVAFVQEGRGDHDVVYGDRSSWRTLEVWEWDREAADYRLTATFRHGSAYQDSSVMAYATLTAKVTPPDQVAAAR